MSQIVTTNLGRFRRVNAGEGLEETWLFECPGCGTWAYLDDDQWNGRVSVDHASMGCAGGYHETHDYAAELLAKMRARTLMGENPLDPEEPPSGEETQANRERES